MPSYDTCKHVTPACPVEATTYGYYPNLGANIFFTAFFGLLGLAQVGLGTYYRTWTFMVALGVGSLMEMAGYVGRDLMNQNPWNQSAFELQIVCIILAPTFVAAGIYLSLKHIILYLGPEHSRLKPKLFTWIFIGCDIGSLILQALGGGVAAAAGNNQHKLEIGNDIIITGIAFQVATMSICGILGLDYFIRFIRRGRESFREQEKAYDAGGRRHGIKIAITALVVSYITVLIRCIYRIPEMAGGWGSELMRKENEFLVLDGTMITIACLSFTLFHPGNFLLSMRTGYKQKHTEGSVPVVDAE